MKKLISGILISAIALSATVFATDTSSEYEKMAQKFQHAVMARSGDIQYATLKSDDGIEYDVQMFPVPQDSEENGQEYILALSDQYMMPRGYYAGEEKWDGYKCVYATIKAEYSLRNNGVEALLTNVSGSWTAPNDPNVRITNRTVEYACKGPSSPSSLGQEGFKSLSSNSFNYNTGFSIYVNKTTAVIRARSNATLQMGSTRTWTLEVEGTVA